MPKLIMMVGLPGVGKSTHVFDNFFNNSDNPVYLSTDFEVDNVAAQMDLTYNDCWGSLIASAQKFVNTKARLAIHHNLDIVWDQTNLTRESRRKKLAMFPPAYKKMALVLLPPEDDEWKMRLENRPGKNISPDIIARMMSTFESPDASEGFDMVQVLG